MIPGSLVSDDDFEITSCVARPNLCGVLAGSAPLEFCNLVRCPAEVAGCLKTQVYDRVLTPGGRYCNCLKTCVERINPPPPKKRHSTKSWLQVLTPSLSYRHL